MTTFKMLINSTGYKKEHIVKTSGISRNKFYFALKAPAILSDKEIGKLAEALKIPKELLQAVIEKDSPAKKQPAETTKTI